MHIDFQLNAISMHVLTKSQSHTLPFTGITSKPNMGITIIFARFWNFVKIFITDSTKRL